MKKLEIRAETEHKGKGLKYAYNVEVGEDVERIQ
jgi:hypothetical protein